MTSYDTIILGTSPNALTAACYIARGGKKVLVLEPYEHIGGASATIEFAAGFKGDICLTSGRLDGSIVKDLKLADHGLDIIQRQSITSLLPDGKSFSLPANMDAAIEVIRGLSEHDAEKYKQFMELVEMATGFMKSANEMAPPVNHPPSKTDVEELSILTAQLKGFGRREMTEVMRLLVMSVRDLMEEWFENAELKGLLASGAIRGINQGPFAGNTVYTLLHHLAQGDGYFRATAKGGLGAISSALSKAAQSYGAEVRTKTGMFKVNVTDGSATGVTVGGESIDATMVISDYDARFTFTELVPPPELEPEFNRAVRHARYSGAVARINFALKELPTFTGLAQEALSGTLIVAPSVKYLEKAYDGAKRGSVSEHPYIEVTIPSLSDATLAPNGKHVMSVWMQYVPYSSKVEPDKIGELAIKQLSEFCPNLKSLVEHTQVIAPKDLESQFHLSEGSLCGGEVNLAQAFYLRPIPGFAQYHTPISQLYLCGSATHPGGINGLSGRNAAREVGVRDMVAV